MSNIYLCKKHWLNSGSFHEKDIAQMFHWWRWLNVISRKLKHACALCQQLYPSGLIKTWFKSVSRFFFLFFLIFISFPIYKKKKKKTFFFVFFLPIFFFFHILSWFFRFPSYFLYSSLFCSIFFQILSQFSYSKGGMLLDAIFSPRILFFFLIKGGVVKGKTKNILFF